MLQQTKQIFALDIGTRSVVGILLNEHQNEKYHISDMIIKEHEERAMLDGQIHDVISVSKIISGIKEQFEKKYGPIKNVCAAAAGRALKTEKASVSIDIKGKPMMTREDILHLELAAVQKAQAKVAEKHDEKTSRHLYCVGYSVLFYRLDGEEIGNLIDQQGDEASVEIIATFLPRIVVESLIAALHRSDLELGALTLEPIAAINVLIPPTMRRLNVALVDIGAGTSDIAITDSGTVIAYGMVPIAGDEITEALSDHYLLDFPLAEKAKKELNTKDIITITDILGMETTVPREEMISAVSDAVDRLAEAICNEIYILNGNKSPKAVMLIGGGSLTPQLPEKIAEKLNLPYNRVAVRGLDAISSLTLSENISKGPELITPIGIAISAQKNPIQYVSVHLNGEPVRLFEVNSLTVGDCLLAAGIKISKLYGKPGMAKVITINGQKITVPGEYGHPPLLLKNGKPCSLDDKIMNNDELTVEKGKDGGKRSVKIKDLLDEIPSRQIKINGKKYFVEPKIWRNGHEAAPETEVEDRDEIIVEMPETIEETLRFLQLHELANEAVPFKLVINGKETYFPSIQGNILKNGIPARLSHSVSQNDDIIIEQKGTISVQQLAEMQHLLLSHSIPVFFNGKELVLTKTICEIKKDGKNLHREDLLYDGDEISIIKKEMKPFILQDVFKHVKVDFPTNYKGTFLLLKNKKETTFFDPLKAGDQLELIWLKDSQDHLMK